MKKTKKMVAFILSLVLMLNNQLSVLVAASANVAFELEKDTEVNKETTVLPGKEAESEPETKFAAQPEIEAEFAAETKNTEEGYKDGADNTQDRLPTSGLLIDGANLSEKENVGLYIMAIPVRGHDYNGQTALRFLARVYIKNQDGTYSPKEITYASYRSNWDFVQLDPTSTKQTGDYRHNYDWQDNRYLHCNVGKDEILAIYPIEWDADKSNWQWFPKPQTWDPGRKTESEAFNEINIADTTDWAFHYEIGTDEFSDFVLDEGICGNSSGCVKMSEGILSSVDTVTNGTVHTVALQGNKVEQIQETSDGLPDGGVIIHLKDLPDDFSQNDFNELGIYVRLSEKGNNEGMSGRVLPVRAAVYVPDLEGHYSWRCDYYGRDNSLEYGKFRRIGTNVTLNAVNELKSHKDAVIVVTPRKFDAQSLWAHSYSFSYGLAPQNNLTNYDIENITSNINGIEKQFIKDENGIYRDGENICNTGKRLAEVSLFLKKRGGINNNLTLSRTEDAGKGLPNYGLLFSVDGRKNIDLNQKETFTFDVKITPSREKKNGEDVIESSRVYFEVRRYTKGADGIWIDQGSSGNSCTEGRDNKSHVAIYPESDTVKIIVNGWEKEDVVYAILPVIPGIPGMRATAAKQFDFTYQISGTRTEDCRIVDIKEQSGLIDPLSKEDGWTVVYGATGPYQDVYPVKELASDDTLVHNLKICVDTREEAAKQEDVQESAFEEDDSYQGVVIRNQAKGYQANYADRDLLDAGELPDVEVTISTPLENLNTAVEWDSESGNATKQLPYRAYLYNYSDGTYVPVEKTKNDEYTEEYYDYYNFGKDGNAIADKPVTQNGNGSGPANETWGVHPGSTSTFHTPLADGQAIVILPSTNIYSFTYQVKIKNGDQYVVESFEVSEGEFCEKRENYYTSGTISNYGQTRQQVILTTIPIQSLDNEKKASYLANTQNMKYLDVTLFDYEFPGLTAKDYSGQSAQYKFLYDPLNNYDYTWNHIGNNKILPFAGIVQTDLGEDGTPVFNYSLPFNLFDENAVTEVTNGGTKAVYPARFEFQYDEVSGTYSYNSHLHHAQLEDNLIRQYDKGLGIKGWGSQAAGFFPFNTFENGEFGIAQTNDYNTWLMDEKELNYHLGMKLSRTFAVPVSGKINGNDMIFRISGDDDIWMFVDGKLVLDIGGIHEAIEGEINFTDGTYSINGHPQNLSEILPGFPEGGLKNAMNSSEWFVGTNHTFDFFYLERGGTLSNMDISFNLPLFSSVTKKVESELEADRDMVFDFEISLYQDPEGKLPYTGDVYQMDFMSASSKKLENKEGKVRINLKHGEEIYFLTAEECQFFSVRELDVEGFQAVWSKENIFLASGMSSNIEKIGTNLTCTNTRQPKKDDTPREDDKGDAPEAGTKFIKAVKTGDNTPIITLELTGIGALMASIVICSIRSKKKKNR